MPIKRISASLAGLEELPYTTLVNESIRLIEDPVSLAIYVYLQTKPEAWIVRRSDIMTRFSIGRDKYQKSMKYLSEIGLIDHIENREETGRFGGKQVVVYAVPPKPEIQAMDGGLKNRNTVKPKYGETVPLESKLSIINEKTNSNKKSTSKKTKQDLDWGVTPLTDDQKTSIKEIRSACKKTLTQLALNAILKEMDMAKNKYGIDYQESIEIWANRGWVGFKSEWAANHKGLNNGTRTNQATLSNLNDTDW